MALERYLATEFADLIHEATLWKWSK